MVFLTSNNSREMSDALKRRCLHLFIDFPSEALEREILAARVPDAGKKLSAELVRIMHALRQLDLKKAPSISETLDWARALLTLNAKELERAAVAQTLNVILKYEGDVRKAEVELDKLLAKPVEERPSDAGPAPTARAARAEKDALRRG